MIEQEYQWLDESSEPKTHTYFGAMDISKVGDILFNPRSNQRYLITASDGINKTVELIREDIPRFWNRFMILRRIYCYFVKPPLIDIKCSTDCLIFSHGITEVKKR